MAGYHSSGDYDYYIEKRNTRTLKEQLKNAREKITQLYDRWEELKKIKTGLDGEI